MVLRCPRCSELKFFRRTQLLGEIVVCPQCATVFGWREAEGQASQSESDTLGTRDGNRPEAKS